MRWCTEGQDEMGRDRTETFGVFFWGGNLVGGGGQAVALPTAPAPDSHYISNSSTSVSALLSFQRTESS